MANAESLAFNEGCDARIMGVPCWMNPYRRQVEFAIWVRWHRGWWDAHQHWGESVKGKCRPLVPVRDSR